MSLNVCLIGQPNSGKTALFNALTGQNFKSTNYPGVTVECRIGKFKTSQKEIEIIDLPGLYSLDSYSFDESIARDYILRKSNKFLSHLNLNTPYDLVFLILDSTRLTKSLYLALEFKKLNIPFILILNMKDSATQRGQEINIDAWSKFWNIKILEISAINKDSIQSLLTAIDQLDVIAPVNPSYIKDISQVKNTAFIAESFKEIDQILEKFTISKIKPDTKTARIDKYLLHPVFGTLFMIVILLGLFQLLFTVSAPFQDLISTGIDYLSQLTKDVIPYPLLRDFLSDGVIAGVGSVIVFLPQILFLSLFIIILEDSGYLARVAFLIDGFMKRLALPGKAIIPLLSSHACAIPGIMSARTLENESDRLTTIAIAPLTACSARIPVYTLLISTLVAPSIYFGPFSVQALIMFFLYMLGLSFGFIVAWILKKKVFKSSAYHLLLELPPYRLPMLKNIIQGLKFRSMAFIKKAGGVILVLSIFLWLLIYFPRVQNTEGSLEAPPIEQSYAGQLGIAINPIFAPLGMDWKMSTALIPSFAAREVMVASLALVNSVGMEKEEEGLLDLHKKIQREYPMDTILALLIWFVFAPQCLSTFAVIKRETHGMKWPLIIFSYTLVLAYTMALLTKALF